MLQPRLQQSFSVFLTFIADYLDQILLFYGFFTAFYAPVFYNLSILPAKLGELYEITT